MKFTLEDYALLRSSDVKLDRDLPIFTKELYHYLKSEWHQDSHHELEPLKNNNIDEFDKIIGFPGSRGYAIMDDSFTGIPYDHTPKLSRTSRILLGWMYGIYLHE